MRRLILLLTVFLSFLCVSAQNKIEKWRIFEVVLKGESKENAYTDVKLSAVFTNGENTKTVTGFYDGKGIFKIRFMPQEIGTWTYVTSSSFKVLHNKKGKFECISNTKNNHGPVIVKDTFNFAYSGGEPYYPFGTTCYGWVHQGDSLAELTLNTLSNGYFNKIRMCIFPKDYDWNKNEPILYPFEGKPLTNWDYNSSVLLMKFSAKISLQHKAATRCMQV